MKIESEEEYKTKSDLLLRQFEENNGVLDSTPELSELIDALSEYEQVHGLQPAPEPGAVSMEEFAETMAQAALPSDDPRKRD